MVFQLDKKVFLLTYEHEAMMRIFSKPVFLRFGDWWRARRLVCGSTRTAAPAIIVPAPLAILVVAIVYAMGTKVALQMANLPGSISPVFPDVGLALAAVLIVGRMALFGIWLGSFAANALGFFHGTVNSGHSATSAVLTAALIAIGTIACASSSA